MKQKTHSKMRYQLLNCASASTFFGSNCVGTTSACICPELFQSGLSAIGKIRLKWDCLLCTLFRAAARLAYVPKAIVA